MSTQACSSNHTRCGSALRATGASDSSSMTAPTLRGRAFRARSRLTPCATPMLLTLCDRLLLRSCARYQLRRRVFRVRQHTRTCRRARDAEAPLAGDEAAQREADRVDKRMSDVDLTRLERATPSMPWTCSTS